MYAEAEADENGRCLMKAMVLKGVTLLLSFRLFPDFFFLQSWSLTFPNPSRSVNKGDDDKTLNQSPGIVFL
jgi:hypothetical protein